jgi:geranylgeranyl diphosphate synthase, type I
MIANSTALLKELESRKREIQAYLNRSEYTKRFKSDHLQSAIYSYINQGGKSLRPVILMLSCGAVGGEEHTALPAAAAIELYHTWTLVHDDLIDRDDKRRGTPTVHSDFASRAMAEMGYRAKEAEHYGLSVAVLTGDIQHAWSISLLTELTKYHVNAELTLALIADLSGRVAASLIEGEMLDVQYASWPIEKIEESFIVDMLWKKTGILYEFAGQAGAAIGRGDSSLQDAMVRSIAAFWGRCGTAFQLQDDILGIVGDESQLGKPVGSDLREGKRTTIVLRAFKEANAAQSAILEKTLGNQNATDEDIAAATALLSDLGGISYTKDLARQYVEEAALYLNTIPPSHHKDLLMLLAEYMVDREF